jgi:hypothetical protein
MSPGLWPVLADIPTTERWDFGGYRYGLEPLTLPAPGSWAPLPARADTAPAARMLLVDDFGVPAELAQAPASADELFWFRWITGHQVSFILWRLIGQLAHEATQGSRDPVETVAPLRHYVRGYCSMLLYTASCSRRTYERVIRPSMRLQHPAFSGSWAPDFWPVRDLLRGRCTVYTGLAEAAELMAAVKLHQLVHDVVAARLVPDGESLLRRSTVRSLDIPMLHLLYDNYFLTVRAVVVEDDVVGQLLRRLVAIARDIEVNGLYPQGDGVDDRAGQRWIADVAACEVGLTGILDDVANSAVRAPGLVVNARPVA